MNPRLPSLNSVHQTVEPTLESLTTSDKKQDFAAEGASDRLVEAILAGHMAEVEKLIDQRVDVSLRDSSGRSPLLVAIEEARWDIVDWLLTAGADAKAFELDTKDTALHKAVAQGNEKTVLTLLEKGASGSASNDLGWTPLHIAVLCDQGDLAEVLLEGGALLEVKTCEGFTPLLLAADENKPDMVQLLLDRGADALAQDHAGQNAVTLATRRGNCQMLDLLLKNKANPNQRDSRGQTALMAATSLAAVNILLKAGADPSIRSRDGVTALHVAAFRDHAAMVRALINAGAPIDAQDYQGNTPLHVAMSREGSTASILLELGASDQIRNHDDVYARDLVQPMRRPRREPREQFLSRPRRRDEQGTAPVESRASTWLNPRTVPLIRAAEHLPGWAHRPSAAWVAGPWSRDLSFPTVIDILDAEGRQQRYSAIEGPMNAEVTLNNPEGKTVYLYARRQGG